MDFNAFDLLDEQGFLGAGYEYSGGKTWPIIAKFDQNGRALWHKRTDNFVPNYGDLFVLPRTNGEFSTIGQRECGSFWQLDVSFLKTDTTSGKISNLPFLENEAVKTQVFPNPSVDGFWIQNTGNQNFTTWELADLNGKILLSGHFFGKQEFIERQNLPGGLYFLKYQGQIKKIIFLNRLK